MTWLAHAALRRIARAFGAVAWGAVLFSLVAQAKDLGGTVSL
jgi:hypothetical protein